MKKILPVAIILGLSFGINAQVTFADDIAEIIYKKEKIIRTKIKKNLLYTNSNRTFKQIKHKKKLLKCFKKCLGNLHIL